jgi:ubiquinone/menaquinone biosynthesis C-methylase UbiE
VIDRVLESEAMDTAEEAREYDLMDHATVNAQFVADLLAAGADWGRPDLQGRFVIDVGTGTARIPIELCRARPACRVAGVDLAHEMLLVARENLVSAGLTVRVAVQCAGAAALPFRDSCSPMVVSNSLIHHLPHPAPALRELCRVASPGGLVFVRDLFRPASQAGVDRIVDMYAAGATARQRQLLGDSLRAALVLDEVRDAVRTLPFARVSLEATSDRHWTLAAVRAA